jgi:hypothetical protein
MLKHSFNNRQINRYRMNKDVDSQIAVLLSHYLGQDELTAEHIVQTYGSTDGLDMVFDYCRENGIHQGAVPLGAYYGYDVAIAGNDLGITDYFVDGSTFEQESLRDNGKRYKRFVLRNIPDAISGAQEIQPPAHLMEEGRTFTILDSTCQMMDLSQPLSTQTTIRRLIQADDLKDSCLLITVSKDLTLPGLRSGLIVSKNADFLNHLRARTEQRYDHVGSLSCYTMLFYAYCLVLNSEVERLGNFQGLPEVLSDTILSCLPMPLDYYERLAISVSDSLKAQRSTLRAGYEHLLESLPPCASVPEGLISGFTCFPALPFYRPTPESLHKFSLHMRDSQSLWVTPMYSFSGTELAWTSMLPDRVKVRVNLSDEAGTADAIDRFARGWESWNK